MTDDKTILVTLTREDLAVSDRDGRVEGLPPYVKSNANTAVTGKGHSVRNDIFLNIAGARARKCPMDS